MHLYLLDEYAYLIGVCWFFLVCVVYLDELVYQLLNKSKMIMSRVLSFSLLLLIGSQLNAQCVITDEVRIAAGTMDGNCGTVSYQGYDYQTVIVGDQCWFAENLRNENYDNGDAIPSGLSDYEWSHTTSGATVVYDESASNLETYGRLYNWYAVDDVRGLCPTGWHVPTDEEWTVMTDFLGGESEAGGQMKTTYGWFDGGNGTNSSGFSGLPGGYRDYFGLFLNAGYFGYWWSSSSDGFDAWCRSLDFNGEDVSRDYYDQRSGFSVRCVQNPE